MLDISRRQYDGGVGLWPTFVLEEIARAHFARLLGDSAAAEESPQVRELVEVGLAREAVDLIVEQAQQGGRQTPVSLGMRVAVFAASTGYKWPEAPGFGPGYAIAYADLSLTPRTTALTGDYYALQREETPASGHALEAQLGTLSVGGRGELVRAWLANCTAAKLASERRGQGTGMRINRGLSDLTDPLLQVRDQSLRDALRAALEPPLVELAGASLRGFAEDKLTSALEGAARAVAMADQAGFMSNSRSVRILTNLPTNAAVAPAFEAALAAMARTRGWPQP